MRLFEISNDYIEFSRAIENGDIPEDQAIDLLESIESSWVEKAEAVGSVIMNLRAEIYAIESAIKRMRERVERTEKRADRLAEYLQWQMQSVGKKEIKTAEWTAKLRKSRPSVEIIDEALIPKPYWRTNIMQSVNKELIMDDAKEGYEVPGIKIKQSEKLRIG